MEKTMVKQAVLLHPMEDHSGADTHTAAHGTLEQVDVPKGGSDPVESPCWSRLLAEPIAPWRIYAGEIHF